MHIRRYGGLLLSIVAAACSSIGPQQERPRGMVVVAFEDATFVSVRPGRPDSPEIAVLWGEPRTRPSAMFIRLKKGPLPMHIHFSDYHLVVMQGVIKHWSANQSESDVKALAHGSYWFQPANEPHAEDCLSDECLLYLVWYGRQGGELAEPKKK
jgi:hypothetical protein